MNNMDRNICRTAVPAIIGAVVAYVVKLWAKMPAADLAYLTPIATTVYYTAVRFLEEKFPKASWLLGCLPVKAAPAPEVKVQATGTVTPPKA